MTPPRRILEDCTYLVSRRVTQRLFLLRPDAMTTQIVEYCLAYCATLVGVELIAWIVMSNHIHLVCRDRKGELPRFLQQFHSLSARSLNARWKRWENLWASESTCAVRLIEDADVLEKVLYSLVNPVADHLVDSVNAWPGSSSVRIMGGGSRTIERPKVFFREGSLPHRVVLRTFTPHGWTGDPASWIRAVLDGVRKREQAAAEERIERGIKLFGRGNVLRVSAFDRPATHEPRRNLRPHVACKNTMRRVAELAALVRFRAKYRDARAEFAAGKHGVEFPVGTWLLRVAFGATCTSAMPLPS